MYYALVPLLSLTPEVSFCECVVTEVSLTSGMRNRWSLSFIQAGRSFYIEVICPQGNNYIYAAWDPSISCFMCTTYLKYIISQLILESLSKIDYIYVGLYLCCLFCSNNTCLPFHQYHTVLINVALYWVS